MFEFGTVYFKPGLAQKGSPDEHLIVVLSVDELNKNVWYQTLTSRVEKIFKFSYGKHPRIDVDAVAFINYQKYAYLDRDTCIMMQYGVVKEAKSVFEYNVQAGQYILKGKILDDNKKSLLLILKCAAQYGKLSEIERKAIFSHYQGATP